MILKVKVIEKEDGTEQIVFSFSEDEEHEDGKVVAEREVEFDGSGGVLIEVTGEEIEVHRVEKLRIDPEVLEKMREKRSEPLDEDKVN